MGLFILNASFESIEDPVVAIEDNVRSSWVVRIAGAAIVGAHVHIAAVIRKKRCNERQ